MQLLINVKIQNLFILAMTVLPLSAFVGSERRGLCIFGVVMHLFGKCKHYKNQAWFHLPEHVS
uniref:Uncharacterized protein n=1 Tax=Scophthalmus maximus TaxID=52904 RepID=A0A8D3CDS8_SCOMX